MAYGAYGAFPRSYYYGYGYGGCCGSCGSHSCSCSSPSVTCTSNAKLLTGATPNLDGLDFAQHEGGTITSFQGQPRGDIFVLEWNGATPIILNNQTSTSAGTVRTLTGGDITINAARPRVAFAYVSCQFMEIGDLGGSTAASAPGTPAVVANVLDISGLSVATVTGGGVVGTINGCSDTTSVIIAWDGTNPTVLQAAALTTIDGGDITLNASRPFVEIRCENGIIYEAGPVPQASATASSAGTPAIVAGVLDVTGFTSVTVTGGGLVTSITGCDDTERILIQWDGATATTINAGVVNTLDGTNIVLNAARPFIWVACENGQLYDDGPTLDTTAATVSVSNSQTGNGVLTVFTITGRRRRSANRPASCHRRHRSDSGNRLHSGGCGCRPSGHIHNRPRQWRGHLLLCGLMNVRPYYRGWRRRSRRPDMAA